MFEQITAAPADEILGINEAFQSDPDPAKINLSVGVYQNEQGLTPILACVKQAEEALLADEMSKGYLGITGHVSYCRRVSELLLGSQHPLIEARRVAAAQTPGGTGALRVAADFIRQSFPQARVWLSQPTWPNHPKIFAAAGVPVQSYPYYDAARFALDEDAMFESLSAIPEGDVLLLHGCCHNPTGVDLQPRHWEAIAQIAHARRLLPLVDFAYQGFGDGLEQDAKGLRILCEHVDELLICSSYSKNFGLYGERVGALTVISGAPESAASVVSQIKQCIRANYSNPPLHGAAIVARVLESPELQAAWQQELADMRDRIHGLRQAFARTMTELDSPVDFGFIVNQQGMFSFSGLSPQQVERLRKEHSIYIVRNGRINVAGMNQQNLPTVCRAIVAVIQEPLTQRSTVA